MDPFGYSLMLLRIVIFLQTESEIRQGYRARKVFVPKICSGFFKRFIALS